MLTLTSAGVAYSSNYCNGACCPSADDVCVEDHVDGGKICCASTGRRPLVCWGGVFTNALRNGSGSAQKHRLNTSLIPSLQAGTATRLCSADKAGGPELPSYSPLCAGPEDASGYCDGQCCTGVCSLNYANDTFLCCEPLNDPLSTLLKHVQGIHASIVQERPIRVVCASG